MSSNTAEKLKDIIKEILKNIYTNEVQSKLNKMKTSEFGASQKSPTLHHIKYVLPYIIELQCVIVEKHGYKSDIEGYGFLQFINDVRTHQQQDFELFELNKQLELIINPDFSDIVDKLNC